MLSHDPVERPRRIVPHADGVPRLGEHQVGSRAEDQLESDQSDDRTRKYQPIRGRENKVLANQKSASCLFNADLVDTEVHAVDFWHDI